MGVDPISLAMMTLGGLSAAGQGYMQMQGTEQQSVQAKNAATTARINAANTDAYYRDELRKTVSNIAAVRASTGMPVDSPTSIAIVREQERISDNQRIAKVTGYQAQAAQSDADAKFYAQAAPIYGALGLIKGASNMAGSFAESDWYKKWASQPLDIRGGF